MLDKKEVNQIEFNGTESVKSFVKKYKKEFRKVFSKEFKTLDGEQVDFFELLDRVIDEARNSGIDGNKIYRIFKKDFKLDYKDMDKVLSVLQEKLMPEGEEKKNADEKLAKRQEHIRQIMAMIQAEQAKSNN
ncbi:MAG: hypothetical protein U9Q85_02820 [Patescibacteria group bacterium]|nr:hypothetical protein [Patescibacteria group bacterium]